MTFLLIFLALFATFMLASLAALVSEKSGTVNIAIEGGMVIGGCSFLIFLNTFENCLGLPGDIIPVLLALLITMGLLMIWNVVLGFATITMLGDHIIAGTALNLLAPVIALALGITLYSKTTLFPYLSGSIPRHVSSDAGWSSLGQWEYLGIILVLLVIAFVIISILLYWTKWGLRLQAAGENPYALETAGISVTKTRYSSLLLVGMLTAISSMAIVIVYENTYITSVYGYGYISFGILIFGGWKMKGITIGSFIIAIVMALAIRWTSMGYSGETAYFIHMIPFILPLVFLMIFKSRTGPSAAGKAFRKDLRE